MLLKMKQSPFPKGCSAPLLLKNPSPSTITVISMVEWKWACVSA